MERTGRGIDEMLPNNAEAGNEQALNGYIEELVWHNGESSEMLEALKRISPEQSVGMRKLEAARGQIETFLKRMDEVIVGEDREKERIKEALTLMIKHHLDQGNRVADGRPFITHPLAVAQRVLETYREHDAVYVVTAALLHDAVEDKPEILAEEGEDTLLRDEKWLLQHSHSSSLKNVSEDALDREGALHGLGHLFGMRTQLIVDSLTSPVSNKEKVSEESSNEDYLEYVRGIFFNKELTQAPAVIKWADLQENAFIGDLFDRAKYEEDNGNELEAERVMDFYLKMREKYKPVLLVVRRFFEEVTEDHPLYKERDKAMQKIDYALANYYA